MRPSKLSPLLFAVLLAAGALTACGSGAGQAADPTTPSSVAAAVVGTTITIKNFAFSPEMLTVSPGSKITVHNGDSVTHTLTSVSKAFTTGEVAPGGTVTFTAPTKSGPYPYICMIHQFMHGSIVVR
jgi:plastocyanin